MMTNLHARMTTVVRLLFISATFIPTSCSAEKDDVNCQTRNFPYRECVITSGNYSGFQVGDSTSAAADDACAQSRNGEILSTVLYTNGVRKGYLDRSICEYKEEALLAETWVFKKPSGLGEHYLYLDFEDDTLVRITAKPSGLDP